MPQQQAAASPIDLIMFDMDGTLIDLGFDFVFWGTLAMQQWAQLNNSDLASARAKFYPLINSTRGSLDFYSLPYWTNAFGLDLEALTKQHAHLIKPLPYAIELLGKLQQMGMPCWLATNAHSQVLNIKLATVPLRPFFAHMVTSDQLNAPKEDQAYWHNLQQLHPFNPATTLFIDDNIEVLQAAQQYGIGHLMCVAQPMLQAPAITQAPFRLLQHLSDVLTYVQQHNKHVGHYNQP